MSDTSDYKILVAIPSINGGKLLARMLPSLRYPASSIVVLDQGSNDATEAVCAEHGVEFIQLGYPHTYTQACNIGARMAKDRGAEFVCVANNDIVFKTDVLNELAAEMRADPRLGIAAPSQIIIDDTLDDQPLSYRVFWSLDRVSFFHDTAEPDRGSERLEADFCELTCALIRLSAIDEIGFLDDEYGFYHEDADFGFRLQEAGYSCAYLPKSQIEHFSSSTFKLEGNARKITYIAKNRIHFAKKHLGLQFHYYTEDPTVIKNTNPLGENLAPYLQRYGLLHPERPELIISYPGAADADYLFTTFSGPDVPEHWIRYHAKYKAVFASTEWMRQAFADAGFSQVYHVPMGVETDIFQPWGISRRISTEKTYLLIAGQAQPNAVRTTLQAWKRFNEINNGGLLVLLGHGLIENFGRAPDSSHRSKSFQIANYNAEGIVIYEIVGSVSAAELAVFYRSVDYTIFVEGNGASMLPILESLASGTPCIFNNYGAALEFDYPGALTFKAALSPDRGGATALGEFEPDIDDLVARLTESLQLGDDEYKRLCLSGYYKVRNNFTLRHTVMRLRKALAELQTRDPSEILDTVRRLQGPGSQAIGWDTDTVSKSARLAQNVSGVIGRVIATFGHIIYQFGTAWQQRGFLAGCRVVGNELHLFWAHRWRQIKRAGTRSVDRVREAVDRRFGRLLPQPGTIKNAVLLIGYIDANLGLGESSRGLALALSQTNIRFGLYPFRVGVEGRLSDAYMPEHYDTVNAYAVNIIEVAANELPTVFENVRRQTLENSYNILRTYWELSKAPEEWRDKIAVVNEIWAPNQFIASSFRNIFDGPITIIPPCVQIPDIEFVGRDAFNLSSDKFYFMFSFDYFSFPQRKNPLAVVRAFRAAFPNPSTPVGLIMKSTGAIGHFPEIKQFLRDVVRQDGRIVVMDAAFTRQEMLSLIKTCDCYVSLHRAEGFGLGMAEAMAFGKPVIATDYSGNTEFVTAETAFPIPFKLRDVPSNEYVHYEGQVWADPDEAACSKAMIEIYSDRSMAQTRADAGKRFVQDRFGAENVGRLTGTRLNDIFSINTGAGKSLLGKQSK